MSFVCRNCRKTVPEECQICPQCGTEIDPFGTIQAPVLRPGGGQARPAGPKPPAAPSPAPPPRERAPAPRNDLTEVDEEPPRRPKVAPKPPSQKPKPRPRPTPAPPSAAPPPVPPVSSHVGYPPTPPPPYAPEAPDAERPKHWFGRLREAIKPGASPTEPNGPARGMAPPPPAPGGMAPPQAPVPGGWPEGQAPPPPYPTAGQSAASWPQQPGPGGWSPPPGSWQPTPPQGSPGASWPAQGPGGNPGASWPQAGPGGWSPPGAPFVPPQGITSERPSDDDEHLRTMGVQGVDINRLKFQTHQHVLQIFDRAGHWVDWQRIGQSGMKIGRVKDGRQHPALSTMATRHLRLSYVEGRLIAEDMGSLNGVYRLVAIPSVLEDGQRFRIGRYVIEYHKATKAEETEPLIGEDGEEFCSADLPILGHLEFIGRNNQPGPRHVLTKGREPTILGRGGRPGRPVDVALPNDDRISGIHAQLRLEGAQMLLEDLGSRNGTFAQLRRATPLEHNDVILVGQLLLRVAVVGM